MSDTLLRTGPRILEKAAHVYDLREFLQCLMDWGLEALGTDSASSFLFNPASRRLSLITSTKDLEPFEFDEKQGVAGTAFNEIDGSGYLIVDGKRLRDSYIDDPGTLPRPPQGLVGILTVRVPLVGEAAFLFCFDIRAANPLQESESHPLTPQQKAAAERLAQELQTLEVRNALRRIWVSQTHQDIRSAGLMPERLHQLGSQLIAELQDALMSRELSRPEAIEIQLVDLRRHIIHSFLSTDMALGFEDAWTHTLRSKDIQADLLRTRMPEVIVGNDTRRFDQGIYREQDHESLVRLWIPLLPFHASLPSFIAPHLVEAQIAKRLEWTDSPGSGGTWRGRQARWIEGEPPEGSAYGTLSIAFKRGSSKRLELLPWTDQLANWCVHKVWELAAKFFPATLSGAVERIGQLCFMLGGCESMKLVTPGPRPRTFEERSYPYDSASQWRVAQLSEVREAENTNPTATPLKYIGNVKSSHPPCDLDTLRNTTNRLVAEAVGWASKLYDRAMEAQAVHESTLHARSLLGTEAQDPVVERICRDACWETQAVAARFYTFEPEKDGNGGCAPKLIGGPVRWPFKADEQLSSEELWFETREAIHLFGKATERLGEQESEPLSRHPLELFRRLETAGTNEPFRKYPLDSTLSRPTLHLPFELLDRSLGVLALTFPETLDRRQRQELRRRAVRWIQRLSTHRLVLIEGFSSCVAKLRQSVATAQRERKPPSRAQESSGRTSFRAFLEEFTGAATNSLHPLGVAGLLVTFHSTVTRDASPSSAPPSAPPRSNALGHTERSLAWVPHESTTGIKAKTLWYETHGTDLRGPCVEAAERGVIKRWGTDQAEEFRAALEAITSTMQGTPETCDGLGWLDTLPTRSITAFSIPVPVRHARLRCQVALSIFVAGTHYLRKFYDTLLLEFGAHLGEALATLMDQRQQELRTYHEREVAARCADFASRTGERDPVGVLLKGLGHRPTTPARDAATSSKPPRYWGLAEDAILWSVGHAEHELIALAGRGAGGDIVERRPIWQREEHPWFDPSEEQLEASPDGTPRREKLIGELHLTTLDLTERGGAYLDEARQTTGKRWLVSVPIIDAQAHFYGLLDLFREVPIPLEDHAVLEQQLARLGAEFCSTLERRRHRRLRTLEPELHAEAAQLLRSYKTAAVHHALVQRLCKHFNCEHANLYLQKPRGLELAASTVVAGPLSPNRRSTLSVHDGAGNVREGLGGVLDIVLATVNHAEPKVVHAIPSDNHSVRSAKHQALLSTVLQQERLVVPILGVAEQAGRLVGVFELASPRSEHPKHSGLFTTEVVTEAQQLAQSLEPILRLVRIIDEHGIQINELMHSLGQPLQALRTEQNQLVRTALCQPRAKDVQIVEHKTRIDEQYNWFLLARDRLGFLAQLYRPLLELRWEPSSLAQEIQQAILGTPRPISGVTFRCYLADLPEVPIERAWMRQALVNLLDNAAKYAWENTYVEVRLAENARGDITIGISNKGVGIPDSDLKKVFEPYYRASVPDRKGQRKGSGLGLTIVREAIQLHSGQVDVTSRASKNLPAPTPGINPIQNVPHLTTFLIKLNRSKLIELAKGQANQQRHD